MSGFRTKFDTALRAVYAATAVFIMIASGALVTAGGAFAQGEELAPAPNGGLVNNQVAAQSSDLGFQSAILSACTQATMQLTGAGPTGVWQNGTASADNCHAVGPNALSNATVQAISGIASAVLPAQFPTGRFRLSEHDGFKASFNPTFRTPTSETSEISGLVSGDLNLTKHLNLQMGRTLRVGGYIGFDKLDTNIETNAFFSSVGVRRVGDADNDSVLVGGYALYTMGTTYLLTITGIDFGETDTTNFLNGFVGSYDTFGFVTGTAVGKVFTLSRHAAMKGLKDKTPAPQKAVKLDIRAGLTYSHHEADGFTEFNPTTGVSGIRFGEAEVDVFAGSLSATLFADIHKASGNLWRPFVKVGVKHRFSYDNELVIPAQVVAIPGQGITATLARNITIDFDDADTFWNVEGGMQIATTKKMTFNASAYYEGSDDIDTIGGRLGVKWALN